ncbi:MAG: hypothetical protein IH851_03925 [Armatimonadetes bacterium]|nr:hypothetical protein [Armatimonadota bacterium]
MDYWHKFSELFVGCWEVAIYGGWYALWPGVALILVGYIRSRRVLDKRPARWLLLSAGPFVAHLIVVAVAAHYYSTRTENDALIPVVMLAMGGSLLLGLVAVWLAAGYRLLAAGALLVAIPITLVTYFVGMMVITNSQL